MTMDNTEKPEKTTEPENTVVPEIAPEPETPPAGPGKEPMSPRRRQFIAISLLAAVIIISVGGSLLLIFNWEYVEELQNKGLFGLFVVSLFAGSPIPIPTPSMILTFTMGSLLNPALVGFVSGIGNGIGNAFIYWSGRGGVEFFRSFSVPDEKGEPKSRIGRFFKRLDIAGRLNRSPFKVLLSVFLLSIYPNPVLTPMIVGMGASRFNFTRFFIAICAGKTVQSMLLSYLGYFGLRSFLRYLGVFDMP
ncbi:MAG: VTT domain-containing protein [Dehalococcoidia bacterium]|jgi:membrane protein YqaA with SNARE-associated domain